MKLNNHPDISTLVSYSAGALNEGMSLIVSCHIAQCEECRQAILQADELGAELIAALEPSELEHDHDDFWDHMDQDLDLEEANLSSSLAPASAVPDELRYCLENDDFDQLNWQRVVPGVKQYKLNLDGADHSSTTRILKIAPGKSIPRHGHTGSELTYILKGAYIDGDNVMSVGDVSDLDDDTNHQPISDPEQGCICLIAMEGKLEFSGLIPNLVQRFSKF